MDPVNEVTKKRPGMKPCQRHESKLSTDLEISSVCGPSSMYGGSRRSLHPHWVCGIGLESSFQMDYELHPAQSDCTSLPMLPPITRRLPEVENNMYYSREQSLLQVQVNESKSIVAVTSTSV